jgi:methylphosphotriester-DNA--protein-cysteine methyltransferase
MRTTVTLDPDVQALVEAAMRERGISFKQAINDAVRAGLRPAKRAGFKQRSFNMGINPEIDYDKVMHLVTALEDEEIIRKLKVGK